MSPPTCVSPLTLRVLSTCRSVTNTARFQVPSPTATPPEVCRPPADTAMAVILMADVSCSGHKLTMAHGFCFVPSSAEFDKSRRKSLGLVSSWPKSDPISSVYIYPCSLVLDPPFLSPPIFSNSFSPPPDHPRASSSLIHLLDYPPSSFLGGGG